MATSTAHDYRLDPSPYRALHTEQGVFTTPPYSGEIKGMWRFADEVTSRKSAEDIYEAFIKYRDEDDFIGMDIARKFLQMGRTRSLRYALRPGGRKYEAPSATASGSNDQTNGKTRTRKGKEIPRTGGVYDEEKVRGARVFEQFLESVWGDEVYIARWGEWRRKQGSDGAIPRKLAEAAVGKRKRRDRRTRESKAAPDPEEDEEVRRQNDPTTNGSGEAGTGTQEPERRSSKRH